MTETIGLFVRYRPVVLALPAGGCQAVANFLGFCTVDELQVDLDDAGLLYQHPQLGSAVSSLLSVELAEPTLGGILHQSLTRLNAFTQCPQLFQWNPDASIDVEPISLQLDSSEGSELLILDLRMRSEEALLPGAHCPQSLIAKLKEQGNLWWVYGKGDDIDGRERNSIDPLEKADWQLILEEMGLTDLPPISLVRALDDFADCAIDFRYSGQFLLSMAKALSMPAEYLEAWQVEGDGVIIDVGDEKIQGFC